MFFLDNHGQNNEDKFTKLTKGGISLESFTVDILKFSGTAVKIWLLGGWAGTCHQFQTFKRFSWDFIIS